jgi:multicomponent Na+:H+ antiporter subunit B
MTSLILRTTARYLLPILLMFSIFVLLRGHSKPGGGFIGGLVAAVAYVLYAIAYDAAATRRVLPVEPRLLIGVGLLVVVGSGMIGMLGSEPFLSGQWEQVTLPGLGMVELGTPVLFDIGVYLVVFGVTLSTILALAEE